MLKGLGYLGSLMRQDVESSLLSDFALHLNTVSQSYWVGLLYCYEVAGLS